MTQEVRVMVGIPASGKSTWIKNEVARLEEEHKTVGVISRDIVRFSILNDNEDYFAHEDEVFEEFVRQVNECMEVGIDVVFVDATHISSGSRFKLLSRLKPDPNTHLVFEVMDTPLEICLERNEKREGRAKVPEKALRRMAKGVHFPKFTEFPHSYGFRDISINTYKTRLNK